MRASRLLAILILLQLRVRLTAEALAEEFEVSVRTIYRDIDSLSAAGIPVYGERGPGGGFQLLDGYRTRLTGLASDEAEAMPMIGLPGPAAALGLGAAASRARGKLMASLAPAMSEDAGRMSARFHLDSVDWYREEAPVTHLPALARAVLDQRVAAMTYESWTATGDWTVEPLGLVLKAGGWYLVAQGGGKVRLFNVAMIHALRVGEARFERPAGFDLATWWADELARFEAGLRPGVATVRATPLGMKRLAQLGAYAAKAVRAAEDGVVRLPIETMEQAAVALLGIGPELEVLDPPELRAQLRTLAEAIAARAA
ncbi:MAG: WYL domain-containing protein [Pseudomonadota bacterium]